MRLFAPAAAAGLVALSACGGAMPGGDSGVLAGTHWRTIEMEGQAVDPALAPTLIVTSDAATGYGGCTGYSSNLQLWGTAITFGAVVLTETPCSMAQTKLQAVYLTTLAAAHRAEVTPSALILRDKDGKVRVRFVRTA